MVGEDDDPRMALQRYRARFATFADDSRQQISKLQSQIVEAEEQVRKIDAALAALDTTPGHEEHRPDDIPMTIKQGVLKVLKALAPRSLSAIEILHHLKTGLGMDYPRTSLSPQLSRLKSEGKIVLERGRWSLPTTENGSEA